MIGPDLNKNMQNPSLRFLPDFIFGGLMKGSIVGFVLCKKIKILKMEVLVQQ
jgi:hypothetical protein